MIFESMISNHSHSFSCPNLGKGWRVGWAQPRGGTPRGQRVLRNEDVRLLRDGCRDRPGTNHSLV